MQNKTPKRASRVDDQYVRHAKRLEKERIGRMLIALVSSVPVSVLVMFVFLLVIPSANIKFLPGENTVFWGICAGAALTWFFSSKAFSLSKTEKESFFCRVLSVAAGFFSSIVFAYGLFPSLNGLVIDDAVIQEEMIVDKIESVSGTKRPDIHYLHLSPASPISDLRGGRFEISATAYDVWSKSSPKKVWLTYGTGLLGAKVQLSISDSPK